MPSQNTLQRYTRKCQIKLRINWKFEIIFIHDSPIWLHHAKSKIFNKILKELTKNIPLHRRNFKPKLAAHPNMDGQVK